MPFKDDRPHSAKAPLWATALCAALLGTVVFVNHTRDAGPPTELRIPAAASATRGQAPRQIRVNLTSKPASLLRVGVAGPFVIRNLQTQRVLQEGERLAPTDVAIGESGIAFGGKMFLRQPLEIAAKSAALVSVNKNSYHGSVRVYPQASGKLTAVNVLPLEEYVSCVIDAEMPAKFPAAAREAQAIVARTYALWQMEQADPAANYDVFATVRSQKYLGAEYLDAKGRRLAGESASSREAAAATRGLVCQADGRLFCTYYSAVCGGATTRGGEIFSDADAVLRSVPCTWCRESDKYQWQKELTSEELLAALKKAPGGKNLTGIQSIRQTAGPQAGVIAAFDIGDGRRTVTVSGMTLRQNLPAGKLLSPHFALKQTGDKITAKGHGFGHGAGLCQWGARGLAKAGKSAREIVEYYYPGATVTER